MTTKVFIKVCLVLIFLNSIVEKTYPEITLLYQLDAQKALFKVPKICNKLNIVHLNCLFALYHTIRENGMTGSVLSSRRVLWNHLS